MITYNILPGTVDVSVVLRIVDSTDGTPETGVVFNTSGIDLEYRREGAASTDITEATLAALTTAHTDGGFLHIGNGYYRLDLPDAACATGVPGVLVHGTVTGMVVMGCYIQLEGLVNSTYTRIGAPAGASHAADVAAVKVDTAAILVDTGTTLDGRIPAALVSGRMDSSTGAMAANVLTATAINADAFTAAKFAADVSAEIADAVWDEDATGHQTTGTFGQAIGDPVADTNSIYKAVVSDATGATVGVDVVAMKVDTAAILVDTGTTLDGRIPAALVSGRIDASVGAMAANVMTAAAANSDLGPEIMASTPTGNGPFPALGIMDIGTAQAADASSVTLRAGFSAAAADMVGVTVWIYSSTNGLHTRGISSAYNNTTKVLTVSGLGTAATGAVLYVLFATPESAAGATAAAIADAVWDEAQADHVAAGSFGETATEVAAILTKITGMVPVSGTIGATGNSTTALHLSGLAWADDAPNSMLLTIQDVSTGLFYSRWIEDFANTGDIATVATLPFTPEASVDLYWVTAVRADVTGGAGLDAAGVRAAVGLASANLDTQLADLPTNAELATSQGTADDATLSAIAGLDTKIDTIDNLLDTEIPALTTAVADLPTNAELATALGTADDAVLAAIAALNNLSIAQVATEIADALGTDTYAEPTGVPAATATLANKLSFVYMALRNRIDVTATKKTFYDDGGASEWEKDLSDDGTTYSESEANAI